MALSAAAVDAELVGQWREMLARRAANMHLLIDDLATTGRLRRGLDRAEAADTVTALASPEVCASLVELSHRTPSRYEAWLAETLARLLPAD